DYAIEQYMSRREVYGDMGMVTPVGDLVPVQYYMAAVYTLFAALAALPLARKTAGDLSGTLLRRGVLSGQNAARFFAARFTSGAALELLLLLTLIPVGLVLRLANYTCSAELAGSLPALLFAILLVACCFSALATAIPLLARSRDTAAWAGFILILLLAFCSGLLVPERMLPDAMQTAAEFLPLAAGMHLISSALFRFDAISCARNAALILLWGLLFAGLGYGGYRKKERTV
ncbi:MAG: ABC transporter permease, partial [Bacillota bacterium]